ncbi:Protein of unknown function [Gryllus bimaculatus]|nr:Protein of unknown function [Gryllus bimaculatus]
MDPGRTMWLGTPPQHRRQGGRANSACTERSLRAASASYSSKRAPTSKGPQSATSSRSTRPWSQALEDRRRRKDWIGFHHDRSYHFGSNLGVGAHSRLSEERLNMFVTVIVDISCSCNYFVCDV